MKRFFKKGLLLWMLFPSFWQIVQAQQQKVENSLFWQVSGKGIEKPSYLFGTYHLLNSGYLEDVPKVKNAMENASGVVVETELDSSKMMQMLSHTVMLDKTMSNLLSKDDYELVAKEVEHSIGGTMSLFEQIKPVFITLMLTMTYNEQENKDFFSKYKGYSIDSYIANWARRNGKMVSTFETMEEQMAILFDHDSVQEQARQLVEFVKTKDEMVKSQVELTKMYLNQDLDGMYKMLQQYSKQFGETDYILDDRNVKWMKKLPGILKRENQFVAVGALHFTGEKGLIKLLREAGYQVKPLPMK